MINSVNTYHWKSDIKKGRRHDDLISRNKDPVPGYSCVLRSGLWNRPHMLWWAQKVLKLN